MHIVFNPFLVQCRLVLSPPPVSALPGSVPGPPAFAKLVKEEWLRLRVGRSLAQDSVAQVAVVGKASRVSVVHTGDNCNLRSGFYSDSKVLPKCYFLKCLQNHYSNNKNNSKIDNSNSSSKIIIIIINNKKQINQSSSNNDSNSRNNNSNSSRSSNNNNSSSSSNINKNSKYRK